MPQLNIEGIGALSVIGKSSPPLLSFHSHCENTVIMSEEKLAALNKRIEELEKQIEESGDAICSSSILVTTRRTIRGDTPTQALVRKAAAEAG